MAEKDNQMERLTESPNQQFPYFVTPDGTEIILRQAVPGTDLDLMRLPLQPPGTPQPLVQTMFNELNAELAPAGQWLAYQSTESGRDEVYVRPFPEVDAGRWQVSTDGGRLPLWSRDGRELFYVSPEGVLMGVRVEPGSSWRNSTPSRMLEGEYLFGIGGGGRTYDIAPDGQRFLMIKAGEGADAPATPRIIVVENWFEELRQRVPTD